MISWVSLLLRLMRFNAKGHEQVFLKPDLFFNWKGDITVNTPLRSITLQFTFIFLLVASYRFAFEGVSYFS